MILIFIQEKDNEPLDWIKTHFALPCENDCATKMFPRLSCLRTKSDKI